MAKTQPYEIEVQPLPELPTRETLERVNDAAILYHAATLPLIRAASVGQVARLTGEEMLYLSGLERQMEAALAAAYGEATGR